MCSIILVIVIIFLTGILIYVLFKFRMTEKRYRSEAEEMSSRAIAAVRIFKRQDAIEHYLLGLPNLNCSHNGLAFDSITLSDCPNLTVLWCHDNELEKLDVSGNTSLYELLCHDNKLTSLDVEKNKKLKKLWCSHNHLTELYLSPSLEYLDCSNNKLELLDVSPCLELYGLYCAENPLKTLIISDSQQDSLWLGDIRKEYPDIQVIVKKN